MDCSLPGSSAHGIFQARVLEWGAIAPQQKKPLQWEAHTLQLESSPNLPQLEKVLTAMKTHHNQK